MNPDPGGGAKPPEASEFLCELMYFIGKFLILKTFYIPPQANQGRGAKTLSGPPPTPRWLRP